MKDQINNLLVVVIVVSMSIFLVSSNPLIRSVVNAQSVGPSGDTWELMASMPTARAQLGVAVANGKIYAIGGSSNDPITRGPALLNVTEEYNPVTNTWATKTPMPTARHSFGIAVYKNKIYCIGGSTNGQELAVNEVYDPATDTWETKIPMPTARAGSSANFVDGKIFLMGGNPGNTTNEVYDPSTDSWTTKAQIPKGVVYSESAEVNNKIYLFGGLSSRNSTQIYDPETDTWTSGAPIPTGVAEGAAAATTGVNASVRIYVIGGETTYVKNGVTFGNVTDLNQVYDLNSNTWSVGAPLPTELHFFGLAAVNDTLYAIGGWPRLIDFLSTNYLYTPIGYGTARQEPASLFPSLLVLALVATAVVIIAVAVLAVIFKKKRARAITYSETL
jgi:N-acetylneuraminic acid mutarotase